MGAASLQKRSKQEVDEIAVNTDRLEVATFGAGRFWGTEKFFRKQFGN
jgi:hypothetical protein